MHLFRVQISGWTASFRYPNLISGYQPTLPAPPISTVLGLLNAAAGEYLSHQQLTLGYYFEYDSKFKDLETIYQFGGTGSQRLKAKSNVMLREVLFNPRLYLYLQDEELADYLRQPQYQLLLGRMNDLASVDSIDEVELQEQSKPTKVKGQLVPFMGNYLQGIIQPLPAYFTNTIPRQNLLTAPYSVIDWRAKDATTKVKAFRDQQLQKGGVDIFFHQLDFASSEVMESAL